MKKFSPRSVNCIGFAIVVMLMAFSTLRAQDNLTGVVEGQVFNSKDRSPIAGATVQFQEKESGGLLSTRTGADGKYSKSLLPPGEYTIRVIKDGYDATQRTLTAYAMEKKIVIPDIYLAPTAGAIATATPTASPSPGATPTPSASPTTAQAAVKDEGSIAVEMNRNDARRSGAYPEREVSTLPLGGATLTRSFDELGLLVVGVAPPPPTQGDVAGPGVGSGVGSAGQFAVNGMRSRSNNFTVDGSDNNDEDIGVRRQGFFSLVPQPIESVKEFQIITLLAPAQYGRNFGGQVNALSKSGGNQIHGAVYGFFNSSQLNSRNPFDTASGNATNPIRSERGQAVLDCGGVNTNGTFQLTDAQCKARNLALTTTNQSGGEDSLTLGQGGAVLGGPIKKNKAFFFVSYERQALNATKEASFAVPSVDRRSIFNMGATGIFADCLTPLDSGFNIRNCNLANASHFFPEFGYPTDLRGAAIFSFFPYPNNPGGVYGPNTFTEVLPASARGNVASGKYDQNFSFHGKPQSFTARYNFTQDWREIPVTGDALFSSLRPRVRTQNFSTFLASELSSTKSNLLRLSYGRTRLVFDELRDPYLIPSETPSSDKRFLLNTTRLENDTQTLPVISNGNLVGIVPNTGPVLIRRSGTTECGLGNCSTLGIGRVGQINIAGFSPIGVDVNNFPQNRVNNTYQIADTLGYRAHNHSFNFGVDIRRIELNSDLPRNSRTLLTFNGAPELNNDPKSTSIFSGNFVPGIDFAASGAPSGAFLSLANKSNSTIGLRYYEYNFFGQDEWRVRRTLSISYGLRYEYNSPPKEMHGVIEKTFNDPALNDLNAVGLKTFIAGRTQIFDSDRNNFAPRVGFAWSPNNPGSRHNTVVRAGFGVFYDQILGAVVSQSRNVFPNFVTVNTGGFGGVNGGAMAFFNPARGGICLAGDCVNQFRPLVFSGTPNTLNPQLTLAQVLNVFASGNNFPNSVSITLPDRRTKTPSAEQYTATIDQQLTSKLLFSIGYVGTRGHNLLRASTPNLGPNNLILPVSSLAGVDCTGFTQITVICGLDPSLAGFVFAPGNVSGAIAAGNPGLIGRPQRTAGPVFIYNSGGRSRYDALQLQLRGRYRFLGENQFQVNYTFSRGRDDASDVFDLAGSSALPQDSLTLAGEYYRSSYDAMHRIAYNYISDSPRFKNHVMQAIFGNTQLAGSGLFQTGLPFTINSIFDVNGDGNLTDRLNTTKGIVSTGNRSQPYRLTVDPSTLLAPVGQDGQIQRNSFRATNLMLDNVALIKTFPFSEGRYKLIFRTEVFNFFNRANYGIPVRFIEDPWFGRSTNTVTPARRIQFALKLAF